MGRRVRDPGPAHQGGDERHPVQGEGHVHLAGLCVCERVHAHPRLCVLRCLFRLFVAICSASLLARARSLSRAPWPPLPLLLSDLSLASPCPLLSNNSRLAWQPAPLGDQQAGGGHGADHLAGVCRANSVPRRHCPWWPAHRGQCACMHPCGYASVGVCIAIRHTWSVCACVRDIAMQ